jgi:succinate-acetate transporter protein
MTTFFLSSANAGLWHGNGAGAALSLALIYGGLAQMLAGMWEFTRKNTFAALAFTSYGAFWIGLYILLNIVKSPASVGVYLLGWTIFTVYMTIAAIHTNKAILSVFCVLTVTFILLTIGAWGAGHASMTKAGGWLGLVTAALAWYTSAAGVLNETAGRTILPVG